MTYGCVGVCIIPIETLDNVQITKNHLFYGNTVMRTAIPVNLQGVPATSFFSSYIFSSLLIQYICICCVFNVNETDISTYNNLLNFDPYC